jgi:hypothetical protein
MHTYAYVEPRTHPRKPTLRRSEVDEDVLELARQIRDTLSNEELWHQLMEWKAVVALKARGFGNDDVEILMRPALTDEQRVMADNLLARIRKDCTPWPK